MKGPVIVRLTRWSFILTSFRALALNLSPSLSSLSKAFRDEAKQNTYPKNST